MIKSCNLKDCYNKNNVFNCLKCRLAYYCSEAHQIQDRSRHEQECKIVPPEIENCLKGDLNLFIESGNLCIVAKTDLQPNKIIANQQFHFSSYLKCSPNDLSVEKEMDCLILVAIQIYKTVSMDCIEFFSQKLDQDPVFTDYIFSKSKINLNMEKFTKCCLIAKKYCLWVYEHGEDPEQDYMTKYPQIILNFALFRHSCTPNCVIQVDDFKISFVVTQEEIKKGDMLTVSYNNYASSFYPYCERKTLLKFECKCPQCLLGADSGRERLITECKMQQKPEEMLEEYNVLSRKIGLKNANFNIARVKSHECIIEWMKECENFIKKYDLRDLHWMAHTLHLWSSRLVLLALNQKKNVENEQFLVQYISNTTRKCIVVNYEILSHLNVLKHFDYKQFQKVSSILKQSSDFCAQEIQDADPFYPEFVSVWYKKNSENVTDAEKVNEIRRKNTMPSDRLKELKLRMKEKLKKKNNEK